MWGGTKGFASHHDTIRFGIPRDHQQASEKEGEEEEDKQKRHEDRRERGGEGPMDVAKEELRWLVHIDVDVVGMAEVIREVHVMTVAPVE